MCLEETEALQSFTVIGGCSYLQVDRNWDLHVSCFESLALWLWDMDTKVTLIGEFMSLVTCVCTQLCSITVPNQWLLHETESRLLPAWSECQQLWLYGHEACFLETGLSHRIVSSRDNSEWTLKLWLEQVHRSCWEVCGMGRVHAWRFA